MKIQYEPLLSDLTTLRLGGRVLALCDVSYGDFGDLALRLGVLGGEPFAFGRGSNILASDDFLPLVLVRVLGELGVRIEDFGVSDKRRLFVPASMSLPRLLSFCAREGLSGLEGLSGVPGSVGGALAMNAGSYGVSFCERLVSVEYFSLERGLLTCEAVDCSWAYRSFCLPNVDAGVGKSDFIVYISVCLELERDFPESIWSRMRENLEKKKSTQPMGTWSAGCVFKNPEGGLSAGRLLDEAGFRGKGLGGMAFSEKHANFLVNVGGGRASEAFELIEMAREEIFKLHGFWLETEVKILR